MHCGSKDLFEKWQYSTISAMSLGMLVFVGKLTNLIFYCECKIMETILYYFIIFENFSTFNDAMWIGIQYFLSLVRYQMQHLILFYMPICTHDYNFLIIRIKYSISIVADKGLKKPLYTSARLKKGEVLYLETHLSRYFDMEVLMLNEICMSTGVGFVIASIVECHM